MIVNRLATNKIVPESQWKASLEHAEERWSMKSMAARAAKGAAVGGAVAGLTGVMAGAMVGALCQDKQSKQTVEPSAVECEYRARWIWKTQDADLIWEFGRTHTLPNRLPEEQRTWINSNRTEKHTRRLLAKIKQQQYSMVYDNQGAAINDGRVVLLGIGDLGIALYYKDAAALRRVFVPWAYFINRPIFVGRAWSVLEEHEMGDTFQMDAGEGCYVGDYMIFGGDVTEKNMELTRILRELQKFLRSRCQTAERK